MLFVSRGTVDYVLRVYRVLNRRIFFFLKLYFGRPFCTGEHSIGLAGYIPTYIYHKQCMEGDVIEGEVQSDATDVATKSSFPYVNLLSLLAGTAVPTRQWMVAGN